jgi:hypothetical protein
LAKFNQQKLQLLSQNKLLLSQNKLLFSDFGVFRKQKQLLLSQKQLLLSDFGVFRKQKQLLLSQNQLLLSDFGVLRKQKQQYGLVKAPDAINRRLYNNQSLVETAIYRVFDCQFCILLQQGIKASNLPSTAISSASNSTGVPLRINSEKSSLGTITVRVYKRVEPVFLIKCVPVGGTNKLSPALMLAILPSHMAIASPLRTKNISTAH